MKFAICDPRSSFFDLRSSILDPRSSILDPRSSILDPQSSGNDDKRVSAADHVGEILVVGQVDAAELLDHLAHFGGGDESVLGMRDRPLRDVFGPGEKITDQLQVMLFRYHVVAEASALAGDDRAPIVAGPAHPGLAPSNWAAPHRGQTLGAGESGKDQIGGRAAYEFVRVVIDAIVRLFIIDYGSAVAPQRNEDFREEPPQRDRFRRE